MPTAFENVLSGSSISLASLLSEATEHGRDVLRHWNARARDLAESVAGWPTPPPGTSSRPEAPNQAPGPFHWFAPLLTPLNQALATFQNTGYGPRTIPVRRAR